MSEIRNVPKLRFQEFSEEWKTNRLDEIAKIERGRFSPRPRNNPIYYGGKFPFVQTGDVVRSNGRISTYSQTLNEKGLEVSKLFPAGTILITIAANIGFSGIIQEDMACPDSLIGLSCKREVQNVFLNYLLQIEQPTMDLLASAAAQKNINVEFLKPYKFTLPSLPEQQRIAEFLTAVDQRIELLQAKKEKLEAYKKSVMQKIFSQQLRFKADDGSEFPNWEERKLGEVCEFRTTNSFSRDKMNYENGEFRNIHYGDIHTKLPTIVDLDQISLPFVNEDIEIRKTFSDNQVEAGDLIIADASEDYNDIGKTIEVINIGNQRVLAGLHTLHAKPAKGYMVMGFGGYLMKSQGVRNQVKKIAQGTKVLSISVPRMSDLDLQLPSPEEQTKIVAFLTALDSTLENLTQQISQTQVWKKGLLQNMFV